MRVLIAVDDSEQAEAVVNTLSPWLRRSEAEVHLVSVVDMTHVKAASRAGEPAFQATPSFRGPSDQQPPPRAAETHGQALERVRVEREQALRKLVLDSMNDLGVEVHVISGDDTAEAIAAYGPELGADMLAVGTHGRSGITRALMGSVAEQVVRKSEIPVIVVREGMHT